MNNKIKRKFHVSSVQGGIRGRLIFGLTLFVVLILIIVWIFQVLLLDYFYEKTKVDQMEKVLSEIEKYFNDKDLDSVCGDLASEYDVCIALYRIQDGKIMERIINKEVSPTCIIHYADTFSLETYYSEALKSGGTLTQRYNLTPGVQNLPQNEENDKEHNNHHRNRLSASRTLVVTVATRALTDSAGNDYAVFINLEFTPVSTVQETRNLQFGYITAFVLLSTLLFAWFFSGKIARPLERMTSEAEQIADGSFNARFYEDGYRETRQLARTLNYAVEEISKTDALQKEIIANVSHDLRTPLTLIAGYAEMMRDLPGENSVENCQYIIDETHRLTTLVNDMLDFSKYNSGCELPKFNVFNLTDSVRATMERYSELVSLNGYSIKFESDDNVNVFADERMILQILYNLLNNAINYTGVDKTVYIRQTLSSEKVVRITVTDTGCGISKDDILKIWDRYYRDGKSHKRAITGSGLGLSIVSRLLRLHSASYGVESTEGVGTSFWFELNVYN